MSAQEIITQHLDLWTEAVTKKSTSGRGSNRKVELTGIKKLRDLILELAVRGKLVEQNPLDESVQLVLEQIQEEIDQEVRADQRKKPKPVLDVSEHEIPFAIPSNWQWVRLGRIAETHTGFAFKSREYTTDGTLVLRVTNINQDGTIDTSDSKYITPEAAETTYSKFQLKEKDILLVMVGGSLGKIGIVDSHALPAVLNQNMWKFQLYGPISKDYFVYGLKHINANQIAITNSTHGHLSQGAYLSKLFPLPPAEEQRRIVQKVDELMVLCDQLEQQTSDQLAAHETLVDTLLGTLTQSENATELADNWASLAAHFDTLFTTEQSIDKLKQTILQLAVMGRLVQQVSGDEPAKKLLNRIQSEKFQSSHSTRQRKSKPLPPILEFEEPFSLPSGWMLSRLDDITDIQGGIAKGKKITGKKICTLPYLRVANVQRSTLDLSEIKEIEIAEDEVERYLVRERDLLITEGGDWDKVGRTAIWDGCIEPMAHQNHVFRARLVLQEQNERWLERYLNSQFARNYFASSSKQTTNLASINKTQLRSCTVPLPPLAEQQRIVQKVDELMALCDQLKERLNQVSKTCCQLAEAVVKQAVN